MVSTVAVAVVPHLDGRRRVEGEAHALDVAQEHPGVLDLHVVRKNIAADDALYVHFLFRTCQSKPTRNNKTHVRK